MIFDAGYGFLRSDGVRVLFGAPGIGISTLNHNDDLISSDGASPTTLFDSYHFDYFSGRTILTGSVTIPARAAIAGSPRKTGDTYQYQQGTATYSLGTHNLGYLPAYFVLDSANSLIINSSLIVPYGGDSSRVTSIKVSTTDIQLVENYTIYSVSLPATTVNYSVYLMDQGIGSSPFTPSTYSLYISDSRIIAAKGKIDTDRRYLVARPGFDILKTPSVYIQSRTTDGIWIARMDYYYNSALSMSYGSPSLAGQNEGAYTRDQMNCYGLLGSLNTPI